MYYLIISPSDGFKLSTADGRGSILEWFLPRKYYHRAPVHIFTLKELSFLGHNYIGLHVRLCRYYFYMYNGLIM